MTENIFDNIGQAFHVEPAKVAPYGSNENLPLIPSEISTELTAETKAASERLKLKEHIDPLGQINHLILAVNSDFHIPRAVPENEPTVATKPVKLVARTADIFGRAFGRMKNWYTAERPVKFFDTFVGHVDSVKNVILKNQVLLKDDDSKFLMVNLGDRGADGEVEADVAYMTRIIDEVRGEVDESLRSIGKIQERSSIWAQGDHEIDPKRHGPKRFIDEMGSFGMQDFVQRVGGEKGFLLVSISTTLKREYIKKRFEKMAESTNPEEQKAWKLFQESTTSQNELINQAAAIARSEGRKVILMGHQASYLLDVASNFDDVAMIVAGHEHKHSNTVKESLKNIKGKSVRVVIPGTPTYGAFGAEINVQPTMDVIDLDGKFDKVDVKEVPVISNAAELI